MWGYWQRSCISFVDNWCNKCNNQTRYVDSWANLGVDITALVQLEMFAHHKSVSDKCPLFLSSLSHTQKIKPSCVSKNTCWEVMVRLNSVRIWILAIHYRNRWLNPLHCEGQGQIEVLRPGFLRHSWFGNLKNLSWKGMDSLFFVWPLLLQAGFFFYGPYISRGSSPFIFSDI